MLVHTQKPVIYEGGRVSSDLEVLVERYISSWQMVEISDGLWCVLILVQTHLSNPTRKLSLCWANHKQLRHSMPLLLLINCLAQVITQVGLD